MRRASILIPIHDKTDTLPLTVDSALRQSVRHLEVILIGDGVTEHVARVASELVSADDRVRFLDFPKGPHHGEIHRHVAIEAADSEAIFYLCDDDLLLPDHVGDLLSLLEDHDLVQSLNGYVDTAGEVRLYAADLSDPDVVAAHLREDIRCNALSITGTAHTRAAYSRVTSWETTPAGWWPDHWQFRKMLGPGFRAATSARMTALQFPTSDGVRGDWTQESRADEIRPWHALVTAPEAQARIDELVSRAKLAQLIEERTQISQMQAELARTARDLSEVLDALEDVRTTAAAERARAAEELAKVVDHVENLNREITVLRDELGVWHGHTERLTVIRAEREAKIEELRARLTRKNATIARLRDGSRRPSQATP